MTGKYKKQYKYMKRNYLILSTIFSILLMFSAFHAQSPTDKTVAPDLSYKIGDLVEASDYRGVWYKSKIVGIKDGKYRVHFFGWSEGFDETVAPERVRDADDFDTVEVSRKGVWEKGYLVDSRYGTEQLIYYPQWDEEEWVKNERVREIGAGGWRDGKIVEVKYGKKGDKWLRATILKRRSGEVYVHYEDTDDTWNEWVSEDKIRRVR